MGYLGRIRGMTGVDTFDRELHPLHGDLEDTGSGHKKAPDPVTRAGAFCLLLCSRYGFVDG